MRYPFLGRVIAFARYTIKAKGRHHLQSPYLFGWYEALRKHRKALSSRSSSMRSYRQYFLSNHEQFNQVDFGNDGKTVSRQVSTYFRTVSKSNHIGQLLSALVSQHQPQTILELGTALGASAAHLVQTAPNNAKLFTFEGSKSLIDLAKEKLVAFSPISIEFIEGDITETLPRKLAELSKVDLAFIDANHKKTPTLQYFNWIKSKCHENTVLIFDDIHWSREMEEAWKAICEDSSVKVSIDFFQVGVVFLNPNLSKEHFVLRW